MLANLPRLPRPAVGQMVDEYVVVFCLGPSVGTLQDLVGDVACVTESSPLPTKNQSHVRSVVWVTSWFDAVRFLVVNAFCSRFRCPLMSFATGV